MKQNRLVRLLSDNAERFNEDLIYYRESKSIIQCITDICEVLEVFEFFEFLGIEVIDDESKLVQRERISTDESRLIEVTIKFKVKFTGKDGLEEEIVSRTFYVPKLIDHFFFKLNGTYYYPIYQLIDKAIFVTHKTYSLKTFLMPIKFRYKKAKLTTTTGKIIKFTEFNTELFRKSISYLYYYFAKFGLYETFEFWGIDKNWIKLLSKADAKRYTDEESLRKKYWVFEITKDKFLAVRKKRFIGNFKNMSFLYEFVRVLKDCKGLDETHKFWIIKLGGLITTSTNKEAKANGVLFSLERIIDKSLKKNMTEIPKEERQEIYSVMKWMISTFEAHQYQDSLSLEYKKLQCWEYISKPLSVFFSNAIFRINNTRNLTLKTLVGIFNINSGFLINKLLSNELVRYKGAVNCIDLFNSALKVTNRGAGSVGSSPDVADSSRGIHPSFIGCIDIVTSSASDPGMTSTIVPFAKIKKGQLVIPEGSRQKKAIL